MTKLYLDSCIYISLLGDASYAEHIRILSKEIKRGSISLIASSLVALEVHAGKLSKEKRHDWNTFLRSKQIQIISPDLDLCFKAAYLGHKYNKNKSVGLKGINNIDAAHLQTAIEQGADEFHTVDEGILSIDINSIYKDSKIRIIRPEWHKNQPN